MRAEACERGNGSEAMTRRGSGTLHIAPACNLDDTISCLSQMRKLQMFVGIKVRFRTESRMTTRRTSKTSGSSCESVRQLAKYDARALVSPVVSNHVASCVTCDKRIRHGIVHVIVAAEHRDVGEGAVPPVQEPELHELVRLHVLNYQGSHLNRTAGGTTAATSSSSRPTSK